MASPSNFPLRLVPKRPPPPPRKVVVAVHGIGDQIRNETVLSTTIRFCDHFNYPGVVALGAFYQVAPDPNAPLPPPVDPTLFVTDPPATEGLSDRIGFTEAYWADIARRLSSESYTLQETKAWARSIVNRVRVLAALKNPGDDTIDYPRIRMVLEEIISTIAVIESLLFLCKKAGIFEFDLKKILDAFLGDVQLMTEFAPVRREIVGRFHRAVKAALTTHADAEIHIVAHSEGTVVALLGLLEAADDPAAHPWIRQVRGFMTIGSPIDKHLILWPKLFEKFKGHDLAAEAAYPAQSGAVTTVGIRATDPAAAGFRERFNVDPNPHPQIRWVNYVDYSDPVGFNLDTARRWLKARDYHWIFGFEEKDDFAFRRYPFPGKAHVDYWMDAEVFGHFIRTVVDPKVETPKEAARLAKGPPGISWVPLVSYGVAYLLPLALFHLAVYALAMGVSDFVDPKSEQPHPNFVHTVLGLSWLVAGMTIWLRLIRLTRTWGWFALGAGIYAAGASGFWLMVRHPDPGLNELMWFERATALFLSNPGIGSIAATGVIILLVLFVNARFWRRAKS